MNLMETVIFRDLREQMRAQPTMAGKWVIVSHAARDKLLRPELLRFLLDDAC
jgi:hypothetical protein